MYSRLTSISTQRAWRKAVMIVCSGDVSSTLQHTISGMPLKKKKKKLQIHS